MVQLSHPYVTNGKTIALTLWTFFSIYLRAVLVEGILFGCGGGCLSVLR